MTMSKQLFIILGPNKLTPAVVKVHRTLKELFPLYYMHSNICHTFKFKATPYFIAPIKRPLGIELKARLCVYHPYNSVEYIIP